MIITEENDRTSERGRTIVALPPIYVKMLGLSGYSQTVEAGQFSIPIVCKVEAYIRLHYRMRSRVNANST